MYPKELSFDRSGSARIRFFGPALNETVHWAKAEVKQLTLICPAEGRCLACNSKSDTNPWLRRVGLGWDVKAKKWCLYMNSAKVFSDIWNEASKHGVTAAAMEAGLGPDVLVQRTNGNIEIAVMPETIGNLDGIPSNRPTIGEMVSAAKKRSLYLKFDSPLKVEEAYPRPERDHP